MRRLLILFATLLATSVNAANYADWWSDPARTGTSINIAQQGDVIFAAWYLYDNSRRAKWLVGAGPIADGRTTVDLYEVSAPFLGPQTEQAATKVGTGTFTFNSTGSILFQYSTTAEGSGTLTLSRFSFEPLPLAGYYYGGYVTTQYDCASSGNNGVFTGTARYGVSVSGSMVSVAEETGSGTCTYSGPLSQHGSRFEASGNFSCTTGISGTWRAQDSLVDDGRLLIKIEAVVPNVCRFRSHVAAVLTSKL